MSDLFPDFRVRSSLGRTYDTSVKDVADYPARLTDVEADAATLASDTAALETGAADLSSVTEEADARANLGVAHWVHMGQVSTKASDSGVLRMPCPQDDCPVLKVKTVLNGALATANATGQLKIGGSNAGSTTTGLVTMTESGSAAGNVDSASPITTNVTADEDDLITFEIGGGSTATATADVFLLLGY